MRMTRFEPETDGFHGVWWPLDSPSGAAIIVILGDDSEDHLAKSGVRWAHNLGVNVLTMSPDKKDYGHHNYPLERIETAVAWLLSHGMRKVGIAGASTTGTLALTAASYVPDITLTLAFTPSDFVWQGFMQGKRDGCKEWPVEGESLFTWHGKPLPYLRFVYQHPEYWHIIEEEGKKTGNLITSRKIFDDSERAAPLTEEQFIKIERIKGRLFVVGAKDDALWDAGRYIRRMETRLAERPHECQTELVVYEHGTHFVFPESMLKQALPLISGPVVGWCFPAARKFPKKCRQTRIDVDKHVRRAIAAWLED